MCILDICKICNYLYAMFYMYIDNVSFLEHYKLTCLFTLAIWLHTIMYIISKNDQWNFTFKLISTNWENMSPIIWSYLLYVLWNQCHCECCIVYLLLWIITFYIWPVPWSCVLYVLYICVYVTSVLFTGDRVIFAESPSAPGIPVVYRTPEERSSNPDRLNLDRYIQSSWRRLT